MLFVLFCFFVNSFIINWVKTQNLQAVTIHPIHTLNPVEVQINKDKDTIKHMFLGNKLWRINDTCTLMWKLRIQRECCWFRRKVYWTENNRSFSSSNWTAWPLLLSVFADSCVRFHIFTLEMKSGKKLQGDRHKTSLERFQQKNSG